MKEKKTNPAYYRPHSADGTGAICLECIRSALTAEEYIGFLKGNIIKYVFREKFKGTDTDLVKAVDYCDEALRQRISMTYWDNSKSANVDEGE